MTVRQLVTISLGRVPYSWKYTSYLLVFNGDKLTDIAPVWAKVCKAFKSLLSLCASGCIIPSINHCYGTGFTLRLMHRWLTDYWLHNRETQMLCQVKLVQLAQIHHKSVSRLQLLPLHESLSFIHLFISHFRYFLFIVIFGQMANSVKFIVQSKDYDDRFACLPPHVG